MKEIIVNNDRIKNIRITRRLTQTQVSKLCGVSKSVYSRYESGERNPSLRVIRKMSKALDCAVDDLIREEASNEE